MNRRSFFKNAAGLTGIALIGKVATFPISAWAQEKRGGGAAAGALVLVKPGEGMAGSVNYVHDHKDLKNAALKTERQGVAWDKQLCKGCMLYTKAGEVGGAEVGKCSIFATGVVKANGWCTSWSKKA